MTPIYHPETAIELAIAESLLEAHEIPYFVHNRGVAGLYPGIQLNLLNARTILVPTSASELAKDVLAQYLADPSGVRQNRERSFWHVLRLIFETLCMGWCVPRVGNVTRQSLEPMALKLVLDTNCIIDLEENRPDARHVKALIDASKGGRVDLAVVAVSASENQPNGITSRDFGVFEKKLNSIGLAGIHQLLPLAIWDVSYWDHALWSSPEMEALESQIRGILFSGISTVAPSNIDENSMWRNHMCDVLVAWSCIYHKWGCLVTRDKNFHDHKAELLALGLQEVLYPADAAQRYAP